MPASCAQRGARCLVPATKSNAALTPTTSAGAIWNACRRIQSSCFGAPRAHQTISGDAERIALTDGWKSTSSRYPCGGEKLPTISALNKRLEQALSHTDENLRRRSEQEMRKPRFLAELEHLHHQIHPSDACRVRHACAALEPATGQPSGSSAHAHSSASRTRASLCARTSTWTLQRHT